MSKKRKNKKSNEEIAREFDLPVRKSKIATIMKQDGEVYCICRSPDGSRFMISCDGCDEWYHGDCINISEKEVEYIRQFYCFRCKEVDPNLHTVFRTVPEKPEIVPRNDSSEHNMNEEIAQEFDLPEMKQDGELYCICRSPAGSRFMISCDGCDEWYHGDCINISEKEVEYIRQFYCFRCKEVDPNLQTVFRTVPEKPEIVPRNDSSEHNMLLHEKLPKLNGQAMEKFDKMSQKIKNKKSNEEIAEEFDLPEMKQDGELYCICRSPAGSRFMICCDGCDEWYHGDCINISEKEVENIPQFYCFRCKEVDPNLQTVFRTVPEKPEIVPRYDSNEHNMVGKKYCGTCDGCRQANCGRCNACRIRVRVDKKRRCPLSICLQISGPRSQLLHEKLPKLNGQAMEKFDKMSQKIKNKKSNEEIAEEFDLREMKQDCELYCICRSSAGSRFMICCDGCDEWYHGDCVNISEKEVENIRQFYCFRCKEVDPNLQTVFRTVPEKPEIVPRYDSNEHNMNEEIAQEFDLPEMKQDGELYCFCRSPDGSRFMICCDGCDEWYHGDCINISETEGDQLCQFYCIRCKEVDPNLQTVFRDVTEKPEIVPHNDSNENNLVGKTNCGTPQATQTSLTTGEAVGLSEEPHVCPGYLNEHNHKDSGSKQRSRNITPPPEVLINPELEVMRQCYGPVCGRNARPQSKYCSDECGMHLATARLHQVVPLRVQEWNVTPSRAEWRNRKQLELIREKKLMVTRALNELNSLKLQLELVIERARHSSVDPNWSQSNNHIKGVKWMNCVTCGNEIQSRTAIKHMEKCFNKYESQASFGRKLKPCSEANTMFCDSYNAASQTYCKRLRVLCTKHWNDPKINDNDVCGCPLVKNMFTVTDEFCRAPKKSCCNHFVWEKIRRAEIDLERVQQWNKMEKLLSLERKIRAMMTSRAGVLNLMLHTTHNHEILDEPLYRECKESA